MKVVKTTTISNGALKNISQSGILQDTTQQENNSNEFDSTRIVHALQID